MWIVLGNTDIYQHQSSNTRHLSMCFCFLSAVFAIPDLVSLVTSFRRCVLLFTAPESWVICLISFGVGCVAVSEQGCFSHVVHSVALLPLFILADIYGHGWGCPCVRSCHRQTHLSSSPYAAVEERSWHNLSILPCARLCSGAYYEMCPGYGLLPQEEGVFWCYV